jgi:hypothetical protein
MPGADQDTVVRLRVGLLGGVALTALACFVEAACAGNVVSSYDPYGQSRGGDTSAIFPFSGPSCPDGPPGTERNVPCGQCETNACAAQLACAQTDCATFLTCACACPLNDSTCQNACPLSMACQACITTYRACSDRAATSTCAAQCPGG